MDHAGEGVDEIHRAAVRTPPEAVGDRQPAHDQLSVAGAIEAVERSGASALIMGHRAGPEPTLRIACGIVHPSSGRCHVSHRAYFAVRAKIAEALFSGEQPTPIAGDRGNRPHGAGHVILATGTMTPSSMILSR